MWRTPLIRKNRLAARLALYLSPVLFAFVVWGVVEVAGRLGIDMGWHGEDFSEIGSVQLLREYLRIDSSYPDGNEIPAAEFLARHLEAAGIPATVERLGRRNANVWAILEGEDPEALVLHNHVDVEPADEPDWRHPPFGGVLDPPFIYGRGAFDMKSYAIVQLLAMLEMKERGGLRRSLIFLGTGSEETDSRMGTIWLLREHPELVSRFWAVLTEGGAVEAIHVEEVKYWGTEFGQKRFADVWVCDASRERLELLRQDLLAAEAPVHGPSEPVARFLERYAATRDNPEIRRALRHPRRLPDEVVAISTTASRRGRPPCGNSPIGRNCPRPAGRPSTKSSTPSPNPAKSPSASPCSGCRMSTRTARAARSRRRLPRTWRAGRS